VIGSVGSVIVCSRRTSAVLAIVGAVRRRACARQTMQRSRADAGETGEQDQRR